MKQIATYLTFPFAQIILVLLKFLVPFSLCIIVFSKAFGLSSKLEYLNMLNVKFNTYFDVLI